AHREEIAAVNEMLAPPIPGQPGVAPYTDGYEELFDIPQNFEDSLDAKPAVHKQWRFEELHSIFGHLDYRDERSWRRALDYYFRLHELSDVQLGIILAALDDIDRWDDTVVVFTSDHGDMCGSHGLVNKGPFAYEEIMHVPLTVRAPGTTAPGSMTAALTSSADIVPTICDLAGGSGASSLSGAGGDRRARARPVGPGARAVRPAGGPRRARQSRRRLQPDQGGSRPVRAPAGARTVGVHPPPPRWGRRRFDPPGGHDGGVRGVS